MGFRFRKSFKIAPGVRLNIGKKSVGISMGGKGSRISVNSRGRVTTSAGIPGTGISYVKTKKIGRNRKETSSKSKIAQNITDCSEMNIAVDSDIKSNPIPKSPKNKKKVIVGVIAVFVIMATIGSFSSEIPDSISANWPDNTFDIHDTPDVEIVVSPDDASISDLVLCNNEIAEMEYSDGIATITFLKDGTADLYFTSSDIESNHAQITVVDKEAEAEAQRIQEEKAATEEQAKLEAEKLAQQEAVQQNSQQQSSNQQQITSSAPSVSVAEPAPQQSQQTQMVWIASSGNGTKYHNDPTCSNMKNPTQISLDEAISIGKTPCSKCY